MAGLLQANSCYPSQWWQRCMMLWCFTRPQWVNTLSSASALTHWGGLTYICASKLITIVSDNGLVPVWRQVITWTNAGILLIGPFRTHFSEILMVIHTFPFKKMHLKMLTGKWWPFCLGVNVLTHWGRDKMAAVSQTTLSNAFSGMKMLEFWLRFHWSLFLRVQSTIIQHWFR